MMHNPYPKTIRDEATGQEFANELHTAWKIGYKACLRDFAEDTFDKLKQETCELKAEIQTLKEMLR